MRRSVVRSFVRVDEERELQREWARAPTVWLDMPRENKTSAPMPIERLRRMQKGMMARSPRLHCQRAKHPVSTAKPTNRPMHRESLHAHFWPRICSTSSRQQTAPRKSAVTRPSMWFSFLRRSNCRLAWLEDWSMWTKRKTTTMTHAPTGTFLEYGQQSIVGRHVVQGALGHHTSKSTILSSRQRFSQGQWNNIMRRITQPNLRQLAWSVKTPPRIGPRHTLMPSELTTIP